MTWNMTMAASHIIQFSEVRRVHDDLRSRLQLIDPTHQLAAYGVHLGKNRRGACPLHGGDNKSAFRFHEGTRGWRWHCESGCDVGDNTGDFIDFLMRLQGLSFPQAIKEASEALGLDYDEEMRRAGVRAQGGKAAPPHLPLLRRVPRPQKPEEKPEELHPGAHLKLEEILYTTLPLDDASCSYLERRGIDPTMAHHLGIRGCDQKTWRDALEQAGLDSEELKGLGLLSEKGHILPYMHHFLLLTYWRHTGGLDTVRFKNTDKQGKVKMMSLIGHQPTAPYLHGQGAVELAIQHALPLVVCEGEVDALSLLAVDVPAIAAPGSNAWNDAWGALLPAQHPIVIVGDKDDAGEKFARQVIKSYILVHGKKEARRWLTPMTGCGEHNDINDALLSTGHHDFLTYFQAQVDAQWRRYHAG